MRSVRKHKIMWAVALAVLVPAALWLICGPMGRRGSRLDHPRPVADADDSPRAMEPLLRTLRLQSLLRREPRLRLDTQQEAALTACIDLSQLVNQVGNGVVQFDTPAVRDQLLEWQRKMSEPFYPEFLLGQWYERNGTADEARPWQQQALEQAPVVLIQRYQFLDGTPLAHTEVGTLSVECRMNTTTSVNTSQSLRYVALITDEKGQVYLPCYDTRIRRDSVQWPQGYEIETGRHGYLEVKARYSLLPTIYAWKKGSPRPATDLPPSQFQNYRDAQQAVGLTYRVDDAEFRIDRCFRLGQDGTVSAGDGRSPAVLPEKEPLPSFGNPLACLDQALVRFKRSTTAGHAILQVRLFDHRARAMLTEYHAPAGWSYDGQDEIFLKSFARPLPQSLDVWFWVSRFSPQDKVQQVLPQVGAMAEFADYKAVLTHVHNGVRSYTATSSAITFGTSFQETESCLQVAFQITSKQTRPRDEYARLVAVNKAGERLMGDHVLRPGQGIFVCDFPMKLSDLDHLDLLPVGRESCFFFDGVSLPGAGNREPAQSWQVVIPTRGQTGSFATTGPQPAHVQITVLRGRNSLSLGNRQLAGTVVGQDYWTYGSGDRDLDSYTTIVCAMTGLTARMLKTEIDPLDAGNNPLGKTHGSGRCGTIVYGSFRIPAQRVDAVRVTLSWSTE